MSTAEIKKHLSSIINNSDDERLLRIVYAVVTSYETNDAELSSEQLEELAKRIKQRKKGNTTSYTWEEVQAKLKSA